MNYEPTNVPDTHIDKTFNRNTVSEVRLLTEYQVVASISN